LKKQEETFDNQCLIDGTLELAKESDLQWKQLLR
jgi:hypothetical protein